MQPAVAPPGPDTAPQSEELRNGDRVHPQRTIGLGAVEVLPTVDCHGALDSQPCHISKAELFDDLASSLVEHVDNIAERATTLGGTALGTARMAAAASSLEEYPEDISAGRDHLAALVGRYAKFAANLRSAAAQAEEYGDADTNDLFVEVSRSVDKHLWFLEAHVQA